MDDPFFRAVVYLLIGAAVATVALSFRDDRPVRGAPAVQHVLMQSTVLAKTQRRSIDA